MKVLVISRVEYKRVNDITACPESGTLTFHFSATRELRTELQICLKGPLAHNNVSSQFKYLKKYLIFRVTLIIRLV